MLIQYCNICGKLPAEANKKRLVRDHNHTTGFIRGLLCDFCNQMLGVYESTNRWIYKHKRRKYWAWVRTYEVRIKYHLQCNTGVIYVDRFKEYYMKTQEKYNVPGTISGRLPLPKCKI